MDHFVASADAAYDGILVPGVAIDILDNDNDHFVYVELNGAVPLVLEEKGTGTASFTVRMTRYFGNAARVIIAAPFDQASNSSFVTLSATGYSDGPYLELMLSSTPQTVTIRPNSNFLGELQTSLKLPVMLETFYANGSPLAHAQLRIPPVEFLLLPAAASTVAQSLDVIESEDSTVVVEGEHGYSDSYVIRFSPCNEELRSSLSVDVVANREDIVFVSPSILHGSLWNSNCEATVTVSAVDDSLPVGETTVILYHELSGVSWDKYPVLASSLPRVSVLVIDDDFAGVIVRETRGSTRTYEGGEGDMYEVRLTMPPTADVTVTAQVVPVRADQNGVVLPQITLGSSDMNTFTMNFTTENWYMFQTVQVIPIDDTVAEGTSWMEWPAQAGTLARIQGHITMDGFGIEPVAVTPSLLSPAHEHGDTINWTLPDEYTAYDPIASAQVEEALQTDILRISHRRGGSSTGILDATTLTGLQLGQEIRKLPDDSSRREGLVYHNMEYIEILLGRGDDEIEVVHTSTAIHSVQTDKGNDVVRLMDVSGHVSVELGEGSDHAEVHMTETNNSIFRDLLMIDGGAGDSDSLLFDNFFGSASDSVLNLTGLFVEVESLRSDPDLQTRSPRGAFAFTVDVNDREAAEILSVNIVMHTDNGDVITVPSIAATATIEEVANSIEGALFDWRYGNGVHVDGRERSFCGMFGISICARDNVFVRKVQSTYFVVLRGEFLLHPRIRDVDVAYPESTALAHEMFLNSTNDIFVRNSYLAYGDMETLDIVMGEWEVVANIRGTTAVTTITLQGQDDLIFVSSDANETPLSAPVTDFLHGDLQYLYKDLHLHVGAGRHRLLISDERSDEASGYYNAPATLTSASLTGMRPGRVGDIYFETTDNWADGITLWLGRGDDILVVTSIHEANEYDSQGFMMRTQTSVHCGPGNDLVQVEVMAKEDMSASSSLSRSLLVVNGQEGDDAISGSGSTVPLVLFGNLGNDLLHGGEAADILFGDYGRVHWEDEDGNIVAVAGGAGWGDKTDGVSRIPTRAFTLERLLGGSDTLHGRGGDDLFFGGYNPAETQDEMDGEEGDDVIIGDSGIFETCPNMQSLSYCGSENISLALQDEFTMLDCEDVDEYAMDDVMSGGLGQDLILGDFARLQFEWNYASTPFRRMVKAETLSFACGGGRDTIFLGGGDDIAFGANKEDEIHGEAGSDVILGDFGFVDLQAALSASRLGLIVSSVDFEDQVEVDADYESEKVDCSRQVNFVAITSFANEGGGDILAGGDGDDFILGQEGNDTITGGDGIDDVLGGHNRIDGEDGGDQILLGAGDDFVVGDNGIITRYVSTIGGCIPWTHDMTWLFYLPPYETELNRTLHLFDPINPLGSDDVLDGGEGDDIIAGQVGDDIIFGGPGNDELIGGSGNDILDGGEGDDILIGDIGFAVRRTYTDGTPVLNDRPYRVWQRDIFLEEIGHIEGSHVVSSPVDAIETFQAIDLFESSLWFMGGTYTRNGERVLDDRGKWRTELLQFRMTAAGTDILRGGNGNDVLVGGRGDDILEGGDGDDILIGDGGSNSLAPCRKNMPRLYNIYRAYEDLSHNYQVPTQGSVFTFEYEVFPEQYRSTEFKKTFVDKAQAVDDPEQLTGYSFLLPHVAGHYMLPSFRITPGFLQDHQQLHGNDELYSGDGDDILIGDDLNGMTLWNLEQFSKVQNMLDDLDESLSYLGARLRVMEVDVENFKLLPDLEPPQSIDYIRVGCDLIVGNTTGTAFIAGDFVKYYGAAIFPTLDETIAMQIVLGIQQHLHDLNYMLANLHVALYEAHRQLLLDSSSYSAGGKPVDHIRHHLHLGNDNIHVEGLSDFVVGDSVMLFHQPDDAYGMWDVRFAQTINPLLREMDATADDELEIHIADNLHPSEGLSSQLVSKLPYFDVPFLLTVGADNITAVDDISSIQSTVIGDFAKLGYVIVPRSVEDREGKSALLTRGIMYHNKIGNTGQVWPRGTWLTLDVFDERYGSATKKKLAPFPVLHPDTFNISGDSTFICTDFYSAVAIVDPDAPFEEEVDWVDAELQDAPFGQLSTITFLKYDPNTVIAEDGVVFKQESGDESLFKTPGSKTVRAAMEKAMVLLADHHLLKQRATDAWSCPRVQDEFDE